MAGESEDENQMQDAGIPADFLLKHTNLLKDKHETI